MELPKGKISLVGTLFRCLSLKECLKGQSHGVDHALVDFMHSSMPLKAPRPVLNFSEAPDFFMEKFLVGIAK